MKIKHFFSFSGFLFTSTQSYESAFIFAGGAIVLASILLFLVPYLLPLEVTAEKNLITQNLQGMISTDIESDQDEKEHEKSAFSDSGIDIGIDINNNSESYSLKKKMSTTFFRDNSFVTSTSGHESERSNLVLRFVDRYIKFSRQLTTRTGSIMFYPPAMEDQDLSYLVIDKISTV